MLLGLNFLLIGCAHRRTAQLLATRVASSDVVFVGVVEKLGPVPDLSRPAFPSQGLVENRLVPIQTVRFRDVRVLKGNLASDSIEVDYVLRNRPPYVANAGLDRRFFHRGSMLIVFARQNVYGGSGDESVIWESRMEERHTERYSKSLESAVEKLLRTSTPEAL